MAKHRETSWRRWKVTSQRSVGRWLLLCTLWKVKPVVKRMDLYLFWGSSVCNMAHFNLLICTCACTRIQTSCAAIAITGPSPLLPGQIAFSQQNSIMDLVQFFVTFFRWVTLLQRDLMLCLFSFPTVRMSPYDPLPHIRLFILGVVSWSPLLFSFQPLVPLSSLLFFHKIEWNMLNMVSVGRKDSSSCVSINPRIRQDLKMAIKTLRKTSRICLTGIDTHEVLFQTDPFIGKWQKCLGNTSDIDMSVDVVYGITRPVHWPVKMLQSKKCFMPPTSSQCDLIRHDLARTKTYAPTTISREHLQIVVVKTQKYLRYFAKRSYWLCATAAITLNMQFLHLQCSDSSCNLSINQLTFINKKVLNHIQLSWNTLCKEDEAKWLSALKNGKVRHCVTSSKPSPN